MPTNDREYMLFGLRIVGDFGVSIAVPVVVLALLGKRLDAAWGTAPLMLVIGFLAAAGISALMIRKKAVAYGKEYQRLVDNDAPKSPPTVRE
jgi:hypothetical protein